MTALDELLQSPTSADKVQAVLNLLLEAPYFYKTDNEDLFMFLRRYTKEFNEFFETNFGWQLTVDAKCGRVFKPRWYNEKITPSNRDIFNFTKRDECIAFMLVLEFFETKLEEAAIGIDDPENLRFLFGDLLDFETRRFQETFPESIENYSDEAVRKILRQIMPQLERYRFLLKIKPPADTFIPQEETIYECLPAMWHYNAIAVSRPVDADPSLVSEATPEEGETQ